MPHRTWLEHYALLWTMGATIGIGQALLSKNKLSWRMVVGRMLCSGGLGVAAAFLGFFKQDATFELQVGLACALATVGSDVFTRLVERYTEK